MIYQSKASPFCIGSLLYISGDAGNISLLTFHNLNQAWQPQRTRLWRFLTGTSHWTLEIAAWQGGTAGHKMKEWNSSGWSEKYGLDINRKYVHTRWYRLKQRVFQYGECLLAALHLRFIYSCWLLAPSQVSGLPNLGDGLSLQMTGTKVARFVFSWHTHTCSRPQCFHCSYESNQRHVWAQASWWQLLIWCKCWWYHSRKLPFAAFALPGPSRKSILDSKTCSESVWFENSIISKEEVPLNSYSCCNGLASKSALISAAGVEHPVVLVSDERSPAALVTAAWHGWVFQGRVRVWNRVKSMKKQTLSLRTWINWAHISFHLKHFHEMQFFQTEKIKTRQK